MPTRAIGRFDPGAFRLNDDLLPSLLTAAPGDRLVVQLLPILWMKMAEGMQANACLDACTTLCYAYQQ